MITRIVKRDGRVVPFDAEKITFAVMNGLSYAMGYMVGVMRYRVFKNMNLFQVLSSMSSGLAAASPKTDPGTAREKTGS